MRIIPKYAGGGVSAFFSIYLNTGGSSSTSISRKETTKVKEDETEKAKNTQIREIVNSFKDANLHTNEMMLLTARVKNLMASVEILTPAEIASGYMDILNVFNTYRNNKSEDDAALKSASENGAVNEYAIYKDLIVGLDGEGKLTYMSPSDLFGDYVTDFTPLTVGLLANLRDRQMSLSNNTTIKLILADSMSYNLFNLYIKQGLTSLGSNKETKNSLYFMGANGPGEPTKELKEAVATLSLFDPETRLKIIGGSVEGTMISSDKLKAIDHLKTYLLSTLPENAKTWASIKTGNPNSEKAAEALINEYLVSMNTTEKSVKFDYDSFLSRNLSLANAEIAAKTKAALEKEDKRKTTAADMFLRGLGSHEDITIRMSGGNAFRVASTTMPLTDATGHPLGQGDTLQDVSKGQYSGILDFTSMTMGGAVINKTNMNLIVMSDGKVTSIDFPSTNRQGYTIPNITLTTVRAKAAADKILASLGIDVTNPESIAKNYQTVNQVYESKGLHPQYNSQGQPTNWTRFAVINGYADERVFGELQVDKSLLREITDDYEANNIVANILKNVKDYETTRKDWWGDSELYEGLIWIPMVYNYLAALTGEDITITLSNEIETAANAARLEKMFQQGSRH